MNRGTPSMVALLGLLAVAGYKNRDKIQELLGGRQGASGGPGLNTQPAQQGAPGGLGGLLGGLGAGTMLSGGIGELIERFKRSGQSQAADSWVSTGPNQPLALINWSKRLVLTFSARCHNTPGFRGTSCCPG